MAMLGFLTITGTVQGAIEGSSTHEINMDEIEILKFDHQVEVPSGSLQQVSAGQTIHGGIKINKLKDRSSPKLAQALCTREVLSEVIFSWYQHSNTGIRELAYKVTLKNALLTKINSWSPHFFENNENEFRIMEDVVFSYEHILWSWGNESEVEYEITAKGAQ
ncbi:type VI secretion system tube protein Hcp [Colwellia sp. MB02u-10]|jgi:type VI secretion system secreted protein Hcp|uniref:type VI secretion system tube protein TssD n=1 Tax=Colwellia sp. MB02u-10 TaxID=2759828 RepID=UPI0015F3B556|nr:type VI secretion system tube protein TssD [Colwellia sp. MB02u-10]MBA6339753.1 type VI secretion system tube protein Hcp [Colwellia sp. MB02u-10]